MFRALQGVAASLWLTYLRCDPYERSTTGQEAQRWFFSCLGLVQPLGFSIGMVLAGVLLMASWMVYLWCRSVGICISGFVFLCLCVSPLSDRISLGQANHHHRSPSPQSTRILPGSGFLAFKRRSATANGSHQPTLAILVRCLLRAASFASQCRCPLHRWLDGRVRCLPTRTQALAGAVFNTVPKFGTSIGFTVMAVVSTSATKNSKYQDKTKADALMVGYRASFWAAFSWIIVACVIGAFGLRKVRKVGLKKD
jgi:hypothetical protein